MTFVSGPVRVDVPATSANLGPGFDTLGIALDLWDRLEGEVLPVSGLEVLVEGEGADGVPLDESHLVVRSMQAAFDALGARPPGLRLRCRNVVPHARGLGSSSAAIVGGVVLARALVERGDELLSDDQAFALVAEIEGHPDNVAPAFFGGFTISGHDDGAFWSVQAPVAAEIGAVVLVPPGGLSTEAARGLLPATVPHADAAANAGRAALLVAALASQPRLLLAATQDLLHQHYREPAMPASLALVAALRADGHAAVVSGAGPTVLVLTSAATDVDDLLARRPDGWRSTYLAVGVPGAHVVEC
ncbi:homoserine kinase [Nocardioides sp.]|uniref:homoserine kinase n=1 Tax=Nocardioides sp. TaxID=35761 RepID=UPI00271F9DAC|nr:homoserine kinase [Nocardioides sp.]MDO9454454.1 homoserine kinase [Nocardioides sp.]